MTQRRLAARTREFVSAVVEAVEELPRGRTADVIGLQLLRAGTSVGANYRAACRARSRKEFIAKMGIVEEEADESALWIELMSESSIVPHRKVEQLLNEANQITAMMVASRKSLSRAGDQKSKF